MKVLSASTVGFAATTLAGSEALGRGNDTERVKTPLGSLFLYFYLRPITPLHAGKSTSEIVLDCRKEHI